MKQKSKLSNLQTANLQTPPTPEPNTACSTKHLGLALAYWFEAAYYPRKTLIIGQLYAAELEAAAPYVTLIRDIRLAYEQTGTLDTETLIAIGG